MSPRKARENEEEEGYPHPSDAHDAFLGIVLPNADLRLRTTDALTSPTLEPQESAATSTVAGAV